MAALPAMQLTDIERYFLGVGRIAQDAQSHAVDQGAGLVVERGQSRLLAVRRAPDAGRQTGFPGRSTGR